MFIRFVNFTREKISVDARLDLIENSLRLRLEASAGNKGFATLAAPDHGLIVGASYWSDDEAMEVAAEALAPLRQQLFAVAGGTLRREEYEIAAGFRQCTPASGAVVELSRFELDLAKVDQLTAIFNEESLPGFKAAAGFCSAELCIDREFGQGVVVTAWEDELSARASSTRARELRVQAAQRAAVRFFGPEVYRVVRWSWAGCCAAGEVTPHPQPGAAQ